MASDSFVADAPARATVGEIFRAFCSTGARGFGGTLPWARRMLVEERRWLSPQDFTDIFSLCQFLPGPNVINVAIVVGARFRGARGAVAALAGLLSVPLVVVLLLAVLYTRFGQTPGVDAVLRGVSPAVAGLVLATGLKMAAPLVRVPRAWAVLLLSFVAIGLLRLPLIPVLLTLAPLSALAAWLLRR